MSSQKGGRWVNALRFIGIGWFVAVSILMGVLGGVWLDEKFGTRPVLIIIGLFLGVGVAFYGVYKMLRSFMHNR
jgi:F0F1-type ATP synthase assembly protein I